MKTYKREDIPDLLKPAVFTRELRDKWCDPGFRKKTSERMKEFRRKKNPISLPTLSIQDD